MLEDPYKIRMIIAHYRALLKLDMSNEKRAQIKRLLAAALAELEAANTSQRE